MIVLTPFCFTARPPSANLAMRLWFGIEIFPDTVLYGLLETVPDSSVIGCIIEVAKVLRFEV